MRDVSDIIKGIIIIEGADCTGKTTLAKYLCDKFKARYMHLRIHKKMEIWHTATVRRAIRLAKKELVVIDRHWPSEETYAYERADGPEYNPKELYKKLKEANTLYVWCAPEDSSKVINMHKNKKLERHEEYSDISKVVERYRRSWYGNNNEHKNFLSSLGMLKEKSNFIRYDVFKEGSMIDVKVYTIINRLRYLKGECPWNESMSNFPLTMSG
jgi:thymidylate kinase|tara:strand:+ start:384 stop:1022 length:639 start_codon:yes stop_codon:yes gene_type:complete